MEPTEVWSGLNAALHELGTLCCDESPSDERKKLRAIHPHLDKSGSGKTSKCQDRHLLPSQLWNRSGTLSGTNKAEVDGGTSWHKVETTDEENSENAFCVKTCKTVRSVEMKDNILPTFYPLSNDLPRNDRFNVLRINNRYSGLTTGKVRSLSCKTVTNSGAGNDQNTTKQGHMRHHHLRPYEIPKGRQRRIRTLSETTETELEVNRIDSLDFPGDYSALDDRGSSSIVSRRLRKSRSLENIRLSYDAKQVPVTEMESMSNQIQDLKMYD